MQTKYPNTLQSVKKLQIGFLPVGETEQGEIGGNMKHACSSKRMEKMKYIKSHAGGG